MGYYYDLAQKYIEFDSDRSYPCPEEQLLWRLDDLHDKREELIEADTMQQDWTRLTDDEIRYAVPEYFGTIVDVERAIELAIEDLKNDYEIDVLEIMENTIVEPDAILYEQISLFDAIALKPLKIA